MADRSEAPSPRRLREARERGVFPTAPAATATGALVGAALAAPLTVRALRSAFGELMGPALRAAAGTAVAPMSRAALAGLMLRAVVPVVGAAAVGAMVSTLAQTSVGFAPGARVSGQRAGGRTLVYGVAVLCVGAFVAPGLLTESSWQVASPVALSVRLRAVGMGLAWRLLCAGAVIAVVDAALAAWRHTEALRMTRAEVDRERRDDQGAPEVRRAREDVAEALREEGATDGDRGPAQRTQG